MLRDGSVALVPAGDIVPGGIVQLEAGDIVPADGRIMRSASLEAQEAALTGESVPVPKDGTTLPAGDVSVGDRSNVLFQNTSVTRGTGAIVVTATGMDTQMGQIATELLRLREGLLTVSVTGAQWLASIGLALLLPLVIEGGKWIRRERLAPAAPHDAPHAVAPARAQPHG